MKRQRGFILIYVVAMTAALTLILMQLNQYKAVPRQTERQLVNALQKQEGEYLLDFVVAGLVSQNVPTDPRYIQFRRLLAEDPARVSELEDALAQLRAMLNDLGFKIDEGRRGAGIAMGSRRDNEGTLFTPRRESISIKLGEHEFKIQVKPANALPNLNTISYESLWRYLRHLGIIEDEAKDLAAALVDWRDEDSFITDLRGAEQDHYLRLQPPYRTRNAPFRQWQELAYVRGVTHDRLQLLREHLFIGTPNMSPAVLHEYTDAASTAALSGISTELAAALLALIGKPETKNSTTPQIVAEARPEDLAAFDAAIEWKPETGRVRIEISGSEMQLAADYDTQEKRLLGRW